MLRVQQLMTHNAQVCKPADSLADAANRMWDQDIGALVVVDEEGRALGMLTDRDICMSAMMTGLPLAAARVADAMSKTLFSVAAQDSIDTVEIVMREHQVRRVPVIDSEGRVVGVLSQNDLVREAARQRERDISTKELSAIAVTATVASIGRSRAGQIKVAPPPSELQR